MIVFNCLSFVALLLIQSPCQRAIPILESSDVYFQSFNFTGLEERKNLYKNQIFPILGDLKDAGIDGVWFPPPSQGYYEKSDWEDNYTPTEWFKFPDKWWLKRILNETKNLGMKVGLIFDFVALCTPPLMNLCQFSEKNKCFNDVKFWFCQMNHQ